MGRPNTYARYPIHTAGSIFRNRSFPISQVSKHFHGGEPLDCCCLIEAQMSAELAKHCRKILTVKYRLNDKMETLFTLNPT